MNLDLFLKGKADFRYIKYKKFQHFVVQESINKMSLDLYINPTGFGDVVWFHYFQR